MSVASKLKSKPVRETAAEAAKGVFGGATRGAKRGAKLGAIQGTATGLGRALRRRDHEERNRRLKTAAAVAGAAGVGTAAYAGRHKIAELAGGTNGNAGEPDEQATSPEPVGMAQPVD